MGARHMALAHGDSVTVMRLRRLLFRIALALSALLLSLSLFAWVEALPNAKDTGFERVRLGMQGRALASMELFDQLGGHTMLRFSDMKANVSLPPDTFRFTPPKGADVMDETAPRK